LNLAEYVHIWKPLINKRFRNNAIQIDINGVGPGGATTSDERAIWRTGDIRWYFKPNIACSFVRDFAFFSKSVCHLQYFLDRLVQGAQRIELQGESLRKRKKAETVEVVDMEG
jgi:hypothetical protein